MNSLVCFAFLTVMISMVCAKDLYRGCIYVEGRCSEECEEGTYSYTTGCGYLTKEPTCDEPNPKPDTDGHICDFSDCYCNPPTVRHTKTRKCVKLEDCKKYD
ncbi:unnamed protein product [Parnassius mnemosyne]|uniref:Uncharacterized protein n=1 Tax=Parnassius mnemosyne TaxID=213953 RepID=A0AAV1LGF6_9NEOP